MNSRLSAKHGEEHNSSAEEQMAMLTFLREEAEANRKSQREEAQANRQLLIDALKIVSPVLTVLVILAGVLGFRDVKSVQESVRQEAATELKSELAKEKQDIDKRISAEVAGQFEPTNIRQIVEKAAESKAQPLIEATLNSQVKEVVAQQSERIKEIATQAINTKMNPLEDKLNISQLYQRVLEDDGDAYDQLVALRDKAAPGDKDFINRVMSDARNTMSNNGDGASGSSDKCNPRSASFKEDLASKDSSKRISALSDCIVWLKKNPAERKISGVDLSVWQLEKELVPQLVMAAAKENSWNARALAIYAINYIFNQAPNYPGGGFDLSDTKALAVWWSSNQGEYYPIELIARASSQDKSSTVQANQDDYQLLLEIQRQKDLASPQLARQLESKLEQMKEQALKNSTTDLIANYAGVNDCSAANQFFETFHDEAAVGSTALVHNLKFLKKCDKFTKDYPVLVTYATNSSSLEVRCIATAALNRWAEVSLDPFEPKTIEAWFSLKQ